MAHTIRKTADIRSQNKKNIVRCLIKNNRITKKELTEKVNLSVATISNLTTQLIKDNIVQICGYQDSEGGRNAGLLSVIEDGRYSLAISFQGKAAVEIRVMTLNKHQLFSVIEEVRAPYEAKDIYEACTRGVAKCEQQFPDLRAKNMGVGIALPGIIEKETKCLVNSTMKELENQRILEELGKHLDCPVYGENESNLLSLAISINMNEVSRAKNMIYLHIDDGLGVGIICNGELLCGKHGLGGEINAFPMCFGENSGEATLEENLCFPSFIKTYELESGQKGITASEFFRLAEGDDPAMEEVFRKKGTLLGQLIVVLDSLFDPEAFYLGGRGAPIFDQLYPYIIKEYQRLLVIKKDKQLELRICKDYERLLAQGCVDLVFEHWDFS